MKPALFILTFCMAMFLFACRNSETKTTASSESPAAHDSVKFKMFCAAFANESNTPNYVVLKVKNLATGETKEVCTETQFLKMAVKLETGSSSQPDCMKYKERYFEFSSDSALSNINFGLYSKADLDKFEKTISVAGIVADVKSGILTTKTFAGGYGREQIMYAHLMFNNGVMVKRGCFIGNICELSYFRPE